MPALPPYPAYRDSGLSWLGHIPAHWEVKPLKHAVLLNPEVLSESTDPNYEIQYIDIGNVDEIEGIANIQEFHFKRAPSRARRRVRQGDTIISTVRTYLKAVAYFENPAENQIVSTGFAVLRPKRDIHPKFLSWLIQSKPFVEKVVVHSTGIGYPAINPSELASLKVWLPPLPEQQAIAAYLDRATARLDALIAKKQRLLALLAEQRAALISQAVTKGLNPSVEMKDSGVEWLGQVPSHWSIKPLFAFFRERQQKNTGNAIDNVLSLSYGRIIRRDVDNNFGLLPESFETYQIVQPGNIILRLTDLQNDKRSLRVGLVEEPGIITSAYVCLEAFGEINRDYAYLLLHAYDLLKVFYTFGGGVRQTMKFADLKHMPLLVPPKDEQVKIIHSIREKTQEIDDLTRKLETAIERLREYRSALISAAVTGKICVQPRA